MTAFVTCCVPVAVRQATGRTRSAPNGLARWIDHQAPEASLSPNGAGAFLTIVMASADVNDAEGNPDSNGFMRPTRLSLGRLALSSSIGQFNTYCF